MREGGREVREGGEGGEGGREVREGGRQTLVNHSQLSQVMFSPEDFQAVMKLVDSMKTEEKEEVKKDEKVKEGEEEDGIKPEQDDKSEERESGVKEEEGVGSEICVRAVIGVVDVTLHSVNCGKLAAVTVQGMCIL